MSLDETLFIGAMRGDSRNLSLTGILDHYARIRDAISETGYVQPVELADLVANASFVYAFNSFKAASLLLPELYHESAAVVLRQLWEVSLNLHWISLDPVIRARDFCNFTVMEYRKIIQLGESDELSEFDAATNSFQTAFRYQDAQGRERMRTNFAISSVRDRCVELGAPWDQEYVLLYHLTSMHAHGAPGAIVRTVFMRHYTDRAAREENAASLVAVLAIDTIVRDVRLLRKMGVIPNCDAVDAAYAVFQNVLKGQLTQRGSGDAAQDAR